MDTGVRAIALRVALLVATLALACVAGAARADGVAGTQMLLRAVVQKRAAVTRFVHPPELRITQQDLARGYLEVPVPVQVQVRNNSPAGYLLTFEWLLPVVRGAQVAGLSAPVAIGELPGSVRQPAFGGGLITRTLILSLSFRLSAQASPGVYPWPLTISAEPI